MPAKQMQLEKSISIYMLFSILQKGLNFLVIPVLALAIAPQGMGRITLLITAVTLLANYLTLSLGAAGIAKTYQYNKRLKIKQAWGNIFFVSHLSGVAIGLVLICLIELIDTHRMINLPRKDLILSVVISFFYAIFLLNQSYLQANKCVKEYCVFGFTYALAIFASACFAVFVLHKGYESYYYSFLLVSVFYYIYILLSAGKRFIFRLDKTLIRQCLKYAMPLLPHSAFGMLIAYTDRLFVGAMLGFVFLGYYGVISQFAAACSVIIMSINTAMSPFYFECIKHKRLEELRCSVDFFVYVFALLVLMLCVFAFPIIHFLTRSPYHPYWYLLPVLGVMYLFNFGYVIYVNSIFYYNTVKVPLITGAGALTNVVLNWVLIKHFGMLGSAVASVFASLVSMIMAMVVSKQYGVITQGRYNSFFLLVICLVSLSWLSFHVVGVVYYGIVNGLIGGILGALFIHVLFYRRFVAPKYRGLIANILKKKLRVQGS